MNFNILAFDCVLGEVEEIEKAVSKVSIDRYRKGDADIQEVALRLLVSLEKIKTMHEEARRIANNVMRHTKKQSQLGYIGPFCRLRVPKDNVVLYNLDKVNESLDTACMFLRSCAGESTFRSNLEMYSFQDKYNAFAERTNVLSQHLGTIYLQLKGEFPDVVCKVAQSFTQSVNLEKAQIASMQRTTPSCSQKTNAKGAAALLLAALFAKAAVERQTHQFLGTEANRRAFGDCKTAFARPNTTRDEDDDLARAIALSLQKD